MKDDELVSVTMAPDHASKGPASPGHPVPPAPSCLLQSPNWPTSEPESDVAMAVAHETRFRSKIRISDLGYETLVYGNVVRQEHATRKPTIHADGRVTVTWQHRTFTVRAFKVTFVGTTKTHVWYTFKLGEVVE